jgi:prepilin-type N-terminal cleavage/methylation domain-containing protein
MKWVFRKIPLQNRNAFTLIEVTVALIILGMITATVLVVVNRAIDTVVRWQAKMQAFEIARENMEKILAQSSVADSVEYGISEENPDITWETTIESFYEPMTNHMWIRAVCSAGFIDDNGEEQKIELTHWLTSLNKEQVLQILEQKQREKEYYGAMAENLGQEPQNQQQEQTTDGQQEQTTEGQQEQTTEGQQEQVTEEQQTEQGQQDAEAQQWKEMEELLGPPPEGYQNWGQVPEEQFWKAVMGEVFKNK